jgi:membrane fusion protein, heavy metal efflux system
VADVPEAQLGHLEPGNSARVVFNSFPTEKFVSRVVSVGDIVDPLTRTVKAQVTLPNKDGRLIAGLYGQMILGIRQQSASTVPVSGIFTALGKTFLFVEKNPGDFERREVVVGLQGSDRVEVLQGVEANERVVSKGVMLLKALSFGY